MLATYQTFFKTFTIQIILRMILILLAVAWCTISRKNTSLEKNTDNNNNNNNNNDNKDL